MLYKAPTTRPSLVRWLRQALPTRPRHRLTDPRDLSPYLQADIGMTDGTPPLRRRA